MTLTDTEGGKNSRYDAAADAKEKSLRQSNSAMNPRKMAIAGKELSQTTTLGNTN